MQAKEVFASKLKKLRETEGLTQAQLGAKLGVSRGSISFYENMERVADIEFLKKVAEHYNCTTDYLLGLSEHENAEAHESFDELIRRFSKSISKLPIDKKKRIVDLSSTLFEALTALRGSDLFDEHLELVSRLFNNLGYVEFMAAVSSNMGRVVEALDLVAAKKMTAEMAENFVGMESGAISTLMSICDSANTSINQAYEKYHGRGFKRSEAFSMGKFIEWTKNISKEEKVL